MENIWVIIVTYNGVAWIDKCINSLRNSSRKVNILVIDNCSSDRTEEIISQYTEVVLIKMTENLGFGKANNIGISYALKQQADYILLLNQDAWIQSNCIEKLVNIQKKYNEYGILSPVHLNGQGDKLDFGFSKYTNRKSLADLQLDIQKEVVSVPFINAAIWFIPCKIFHAIGGFDPLFPHYGEDTDLVHRLIYHGYKIGYLPDAFGYHDRENRISDKMKFLQHEYIYFLTIVKNINCNFVKALFIFLTQALHNGMVNKETKGYLKICLRIIANIHIILPGRKKAKTGGLLFLNAHV